MFQVSVGDNVDVTDQVCRENIYETVEKFQVTLRSMILLSDYIVQLLGSLFYGILMHHVFTGLVCV